MKSNVVIAAVSLVSGALAGALGGYFFAKKKYRTIADEEIQMAQKRMMDILDKYEAENEGILYPDTPDEVLEKAHEDEPKYTEYNKSYAPVKEDVKAYEDMIDEVYPGRFEGREDDIRIEYTSDDYPREEMKDQPYLIENPEFGELVGYSKLSLIYYAQQILADEDGEIIEDPDYVVGMENLSQCMLAGDTYYIRNDQLKCDYEVFVDPREYHEALLEEYTPTEEEA